MLNFGKMRVLGRTYRHVNRYRQIIGVFLKYGFEEIRDTSYGKIGRNFVSKIKRPQLERLSRAKRVRLALEELGPTFIKFGQILSTRPDLIPLEYLEELSELQDNVAPVPYTDIKEIIKSEIGLFPEEIFDRIEEHPLGSASIAQVHKARLKSGEAVVVKVQRPNIKKIIEVDLEIMFNVISLIKGQLEDMGIFRPHRILEQFAHSIEKELNFTIEGSHIERFAKHFATDDSIHVPKVYRETSTERMLTIEYIDGVKASNIDELRQRGFDLDVLSSRGAKLIMRQIFEFGFFHADPHPGNIFILSNNVLCYIDFGLMGRISKEERQTIADMLVSIVNNNEANIVKSLLKLTLYEKEPDKEGLERDIVELVDQHIYLPLNELRMGKLTRQLLEITARHRLSLKPDLFLMIKALSCMETLSKKFEVEFQIAKYAESFIREFQLRKFSPKKIIMEIQNTSTDFIHFLRDFPAEIRSILAFVRDGDIRIQLEHRGLDSMLHTHDRVSNRLAFAIVLASLIIGSSLIILSNIPPHWQGIPVVGLVGFVVAGIMGFWLLITIIKHGKM